MTAFTISDDVTSSGGGLSANAMALGADTNLIFTLKPEISDGAVTGLNDDGLLTVSRSLRLRKAAVLAAARVASSDLPTAEIIGNVKIQRGNTVAAQLGFSIPPSGQIPAPNPTTELVKDATSSISKVRNKRLRFAVSRIDASGSTQAGSATPEQWLGVGTSGYQHSYRLIISDTPAQNNITPANIDMTVVAYDSSTDKEMAPYAFTLGHALGPFAADPAYNYTGFGAGNTGNLPEGTVIQLLAVTKFADGSMISMGAQKSFTITASGALSLSTPWIGGSGTYIQSQLVSGQPQNGFTYVNGNTGVLYKLSTQSTWSYADPAGNSFVIANTFTEGGIATPPSSRTFPGANRVEFYLSVSPNPLSSYTNSEWMQRIKFKMFTNNRQVWGPGATIVAPEFGSWQYQLEAANGTGGATFTMYESYGGWRQAYAAGAPRGDQFYVDGEKVSININTPARFGVTGLRIYVSESVADTQTGAASSWGVFKLIYDGPYVATFSYKGTIINSSPTLPATNTTNTYATLAGQLSWDAADPTEILVQPGDQIVVACVSGSLPSNGRSFIQLALPVEFIS